MSKQVEALTGAIIVGWNDQKIKQLAMQYMQDNGYRLTPAGKALAINELQGLDYPSTIIAAMGTAIALLEEEQL